MNLEIFVERNGLQLQFHALNTVLQAMELFICAMNTLMKRKTHWCFTPRKRDISGYNWKTAFRRCWRISLVETFGSLCLLAKSA